MRRLTTGLVALSLALVAAGCGDGGDGGSTATSDTKSTTSETASGGSSSDAVDWADKVCSSIKDDVAALTQTPDLDSSNPQAAKDGLVAYFGTLESSLDGMASAVQEAGTPPVDGGEDAVKTFTDQIATAKDAVTAAKGKIEAAPVNDPAGFQAAAAGAMSDLASLGDLDPTTALSSNKELADAYNKAPACKELEVGGSTPTS